MIQCKTRQFGAVEVDFERIKPPKTKSNNPLDQRVICYTAAGKRAGYVTLRDLPREAIPSLVRREHSL